MAKIELILKEHVMDLGDESDRVLVSPGYARNYLLPMGKAKLATDVAKSELAMLKKRREAREAHQLEEMTHLKDTIDKLPPLVIKMKTGESGKLFGAVTAGMIADELHHLYGVELDKGKIILPHKKITELGEHNVELKLHAEIHGVLKVKVESSTQVEHPVAAAEPVPAEAPTRGARGDRPHRADRAERTEGGVKTGAADKAAQPAHADAEKPVRKRKA